MRRSNKRRVSHSQAQVQEAVTIPKWSVLRSLSGDELAALCVLFEVDTDTTQRQRSALNTLRKAQSV